MNTERIDWKRVITLGGTMMATVIGSGFATGQEIVQYFVAWGFKGLLGGVAITLLFSFVGSTFLTTGYDHKDELEKPNDVYTVYAGKYLGKFYDLFSTVFLFLSYSLMIGGAGATINQQFGVPYWVGGLMMLVAVILTVFMGLTKLTDILGNLGPFIAISTLILGAVTLVRKFTGLAAAPQVITAAVESGTIQVASSSWWLAAFNYVGFNMIWIAAILSQNGREEPSRRQAGLGGVVGGFGLGSAIFVMTLAFMADFESIAGSQVPTLVVANDLHPWVGIFFSLVICLGIYTSAVPLLWTPVSAFSEQGTTRYRVLTLVLGLVGFVIGISFTFDRLVNVVYVINGYIGLLLMALMFVYVIRRHFSAKA